VLPDGAVNVNKEREMNREVIRERVRDQMEADFLPEPSPDTLSQLDRRMVNAVEYAAYHLGAIDKKLVRLIVLLEASVPKTTVHVAIRTACRRFLAWRRHLDW
jgi:hypothetical protein